MMNNLPAEMIVITGPTATGKTKLAAEVAYRLGSEVISADSRQIYRGMDLGTGKDMAEYKLTGGEVKCHMIDIVDAGYRYNVYEYQQDFLKVYEKLRDRKLIPVVCGGSGMYVDSIISGYRLTQVPVNEKLRISLSGKSLGELTKILSEYRRLHNKTDVDTIKRAVRAIEIEEYYATHPEDVKPFPMIRHVVIGIMVDRETRRQRITLRLKERIDEGMISEVQKLLDQGVHPDDLIYYGLEYKYITLYILGRMSFEEMFNKLEIEIHRFAKRQMTWFRGMERRGIKINWIDGLLPDEEKVNMVLAIAGFK